MSDGADEGIRREHFLAHWRASNEPAAGKWAQKRRLAAAMRRVIDRLATSDAPEDELADAAERLERYAEHLETHPQGRLYTGYAESANAGSAGAFFDASPVIGQANPLAPPLAMAADEGEITATVNFGAAYEGPPGCVHGGWIAAAFDEYLGFVLSATGNPGMTGTLRVLYRNPTPLQTDLRFETDAIEHASRKTIVRGRLLAGDRLCAEGEGIFVRIDASKFADLLARREEGSPSDDA